MKRTTDISNIKVFTQDGAELGNVVQAQAVVRDKCGDQWIVTVKNQQTVK